MATSSTSQTCTLLKLPSKIRTQIYEHVFGLPLAHAVDILDVPVSPVPKAILSTCRQIHNEAHDLYIETFRAYWTKTRFVVDVFDDTERPFDFEAHLDKPHKTRTADGERKARVYAKVQELRDEDVAHICDAYIYDNSYDSCWTLGEPYSDFWSLNFPAPAGRTSKDRTMSSKDLLVPLDKLEAMAEARLPFLMALGTSHFGHATVNPWPWADVAKARKIIDRHGLSKEELMNFVRVACWDFQPNPKVSPAVEKLFEEVVRQHAEIIEKFDKAQS